MKSLKAICTATLLALVLSVPVYAGDINTPGAPNPGSRSAGEPTEEVTTDPSTSGILPGDISTPGFADLLLALVSLV